MISAGTAVNPGATPPPVASTPPAATGASSSPTMSMGSASGGASAAGAALQAIGAVHSYISQQNIMEIQEDMAVAHYGHQENMAGIKRDMEVTNLKAQEEKIHVQVAGNKEYLAAKVKRKKAQGELAVAEEKVNQKKLTKEAGKVDKGALNKLFAQYSYGNPVQA